MNQKNIRERLLEIERDEEILSFSFRNGMPIWSYIRSYFLFALSDAFSDYEAFKNANNSYASRVGQVRKYVFNVLRYNMLLNRQQYDIVIFSSDVYNIKNTNGKYVNRLHDHYYKQFPNRTLVIEKSHKYNFSKPKLNTHVRYSDALFILAKLLARFSMNRQLDRKMMSDFVSYLREKVLNNGDPLDVKYDKKASDIIDSIALKLLKANKEIRIFEKMINHFLRSTKPCIVFIDDACYGGLNSVIIGAARKLGIATAEFQHGFVSQNHFAYCFHESIKDNNLLKKYLPDYFLSFGEYWSAKINVASRKISIGHPEYPSKVCSENKKIDILIISGELHAAKLIGLTNEISDRLVDSTIVYRLHPSEVDRYDTYKKKLSKPNIRIDFTESIKDLLQQSVNVIGVDSTVLWEASAFTDRIFIYNCIDGLSDYVDPLYANWFKNVEELIVKLDKVDIYKIDISNKIWNPDAEGKYREFITTKLNRN